MGVVDIELAGLCYGVSTDEIGKPVREPGFDGQYEVSNLGRVRRTHQMLKAHRLMWLKWQKKPPHR
ncbi:MAG TPA: NUMOD4 domain-containing protein [Stellaceae bacterium]|nr:NUMOD4 domain-containing protein [Stellaceae bacterium]